jgi:long-chain acyl-CoA synthetase
MEVLTAAAAERMQRHAAGGLAAAGARAGDRVALLLPASAGLLVTALAALRRGVVPVLFDPALAPADRAGLLADCDPALVVDSADGLARLLAGAPAELAEAPLGRPMHYTSGTTGRRKGVWSGVLDPAAGMALWREEAELWGFYPGDRHLVMSTLYHSAPLRFAMGTLLAGGEVALPGRFEAGRVLDAIARYRPTTTFCVPTHLRRLLAAGGSAAGLPPLDAFRLLAHAGEPCPPDLKRRVLDAFPADGVYEFYGSTEGQFTVCSADEWRERPGTVGRARPNRALRVAADRTVWCRVPAYARFTYWRDPAKTAAAWRGDELTVGDLGTLDPDGYLYLDARREDLVITGGVNVYPREVERVLGECPGVDEIAVFGVPDERWGQRLCAAVAGTVTEEELGEFARGRLPGARRPKEYHRVPELPRNANGKIRRLDLPAALGLPGGARAGRAVRDRTDGHDEPEGA